ncbi:MAG: hypothetical protein ACXIVF_15390 [Rhizobiaceae bacterium]
MMYGTYLRRWSLTETGQFECVHDAVDVGTISAETRTSIEDRNAALHAVRADVEEYEAALRVTEPDEPHTQPVLDDEGEEISTEPTPAFEAWTSAQTVIGMASDAIKALARIRADEPTLDVETGDNLDLALVMSEWGDEPEIVLPTEAEIARSRMVSLSPRQMRLVMLAIGLSDNDVEQTIAAIEDEHERAGAMIEWRWATQYDRTHPLVGMLSAMMEFDPEQIDSLWEWAAGL